MSSISSLALRVVDVARSIKKGSMVVAVGTKKGGFLFHSPDRRKWSVEGPFNAGGAVYHMTLDPRDGHTIYAGVEPAALFRSDDRGDTWQDFESLNYHPTRKDWQPGNGGLCLHSVLVDPKNPRHLMIGISAV